ncbi:MFS transporter [Streptomyces sp. NPDC091972]|uniref:MFS transporter n=1 Tax=Streptomyces sp. NPDC091972 TaxID=3366007 RepID=UPI003801DEF8
MTETAEATATPGLDGTQLQYRRRWAGLAVLLAGTILSPVDFFIVNVALPSISEDLAAGPTPTQLIVAAYSSAYAVLLITGGRLGDLFGRRRIFLIGLSGFGLASALSGTAWSADVLVGARTLQGAFAAVLMPQALAAIRTMFPERERPKALGVYGMTFGAGSVIGQLMGGVLIAVDPWGLGWRSVFLVNLPIVLVVAPLARVLLPENRPPRASTADPAGVIMLAIALGALVVPLTVGPEQNWPWWTVVLPICCPPLLVLFWHQEHRLLQRGADPVVPPPLLRIPGLVRALTAALFFNAFASLFLVFSVYQQAGRSSGPLSAGLAIVPLGIGFVSSPLALARLTERLGDRVVVLGTALVTTGLLGTACASLSSSPWPLAAALLVTGAGQGLTLPALARLVIERVRGRWAGMASGLVNSALQIGGSLAVALVGSLFYAVLGVHPRPDDAQRAFFWATTTIALCTAVAAWLVNGLAASAQTSSEES